MEKNNSTVYSVIQNLRLADKLLGKTILISGPTGLIGSAIISFFIFFNDLHPDNPIQVCALTHTAGKANEKWGNYPHIKIVDWNTTWEDHYKEKADYFIHCAAITDSKMFVEKPVNTIDSILGDSRRVLNFIQKSSNCEMLYLSSMEVYVVKNFANFPIKEDGYGYLDHLSVRSCYPQAKALTETMCISFVKQYQCKITIARLCQVLSTEFQENDQRMFAQFIRNAKIKGKITLYSSGDTRRTYCSLPDCISALLCILLKGESGEAYNVANEDMNYSVKEIANFVCEKYGSTLEYDIQSEQGNGYLPVLKMQLENEKLKKLGWNAHIGLEKILQDME